MIGWHVADTAHFCVFIDMEGFQEDRSDLSEFCFNSLHSDLNLSVD